MMKNVTLTPKQIEIVKKRYKHTTLRQLAADLGISQGMLSENIILLGLQKTTVRQITEIPSKNGFFDEVTYARLCII